MAKLTPAQLLDSIAISVNGPSAWDLELSLDITFTDLDTNYQVSLRNGFLVYVEKPAEGRCAIALKLTMGRMLQLVGRDTDSAGMEITGDASVLTKLVEVLETGVRNFNIVTP